MNDVSEKELRKTYLAKLNTVVDLACNLLGGGWTYHAAAVSQDHDELAALGKITTLKQAAKVEQIGWRVGDLGNYGGLEDIGNALVRVSEFYRSGYPVESREMEDADEFIKELQDLVAARNRHRGP